MSHAPTALPPDPQAEYRDLVKDCVLMAPDFSGVVTVEDLPELTHDDIALIKRSKGIEAFSDEAARLALLADVMQEHEIQNERRAEARDQVQFERFHGADSPQTERERLEVEFGVRSLFR